MLFLVSWFFPQFLLYTVPCSQIVECIYIWHLAHHSVRQNSSRTGALIRKLIIFSKKKNKKKIPYLLNKINCWLQIEAKVDELPLDTFTLIFFLFKDEHLKIAEIFIIFLFILLLFPAFIITAGLGAVHNLRLQVEVGGW